MKQQFDTTKFSTTPFQQRVNKPWGHEIIYTLAEAPVTGKILHVKAGKRLSLQYHDEKVETLCLISGEGKLVLSDSSGKQKEIKMQKEKGYFIRPGQIHRIIAVSDIIVIEPSTAEIGNTFRLEDDYSRQTETEEMRKEKDRGWQK